MRRVEYTSQESTGLRRVSREGTVRSPVPMHGYMAWKPKYTREEVRGGAHAPSRAPLHAAGCFME